MNLAKVVFVLPEVVKDPFEIIGALELTYRSLKDLNQDLDKGPEINVIYHEMEISWLENLAFNVRFIQRKKSDFGLLSSVKYANALTELFNITHVFNYDDTLGALSFVRALKSRECVGYKSLSQKYVYSYFIDKKSNVGPVFYGHLTESFFNNSPEVLFYELTNHSYENFFKEPQVEPFILIALKNNVISHYHKSILEELLVSFVDLKVILFSPNKIKNVTDLNSEQLQLIDATGVSVEHFEKYLTHAIGVISDNITIARSCNYHLKENILILEDGQMLAHPYMVNKTVVCMRRSDERYHIDYLNGEQETLEDLEGALADIVHLVFKI